ncbi:pteridine-dependent deoxygenase like protein [Thioalkalivibrio sp.]|uniref:chorismate transformation enzyme, FkbO/Hyg5 family n=1 Tax=Thioalkalivibrio sp. TaxID=2093813 RepID=UPI0012D53A62|nr:pteridine-dependent deoxygenase like protein [Thioalkalivibrio sp.]TVP83517.1 MAG: pteridine-dependent deoxygenase like protein [Thioalkalivibrio sp.]
MALPLKTSLLPPHASESGSCACLRVRADLPPAVTLSDGCLLVAPGLESVAGGSSVEEWRVDGPGHAAREGPVHLLEHADVLFAAWHQPDDPLADNAYQAYLNLFQAIRARGFPHPIRIWNYFSRIHGDECGLERYQSFCIGRGKALDELGVTEESMPAATAIGTRAAGLFVYLIAARNPGQAIENPRQVSAYRYPEQYSPESPAFARATRIETDLGPQLLLSGTASITGHESRHIGDCAAQTREILANLDALHATAGPDVPPPAWLRVYLRRPEDQPEVAAILALHYPRPPALHWVYGDVCRRELLVEIEGVHARTA